MASKRGAGITCLAVLVLIASSLPGALGEVTGQAVHSRYAGFAEPLDAYSLGTEEISFASAAESKTLSVTTSDSAVYRYGYVSYDGNGWQMFELSGNPLGGDWLNGSVSAQVPMEPSDFGLTQERLSTQMNFVVVYSCSRTEEVWDCHNGWQIWQFDASLEEASTTEVISVSASDAIDSTLPENTLDGDVSWESRWTAKGDGQWVQYGLSRDAMIDTVRLSGYSGSERTVYFSVELSLDGSSWTEVYDGEKLIEGPELYTVTFPQTLARYLRLVGHGSSISGPDGWNSYTEVQIEDFPADVTPSDPCDYLDCNDGDPCTLDSCIGGSCSSIPVTSCASGDSCCPSSCDYTTDGDCSQPPEPDADAIDVIGPHEFWTHQNAQDGDYVGYVKFFDMDDSVEPAFSIVSGNNGAFSMTKTMESSGDNFPSGLIKIADRTRLTPGATYTLGVRIRDTATEKDSSAPVTIHVSTDAETVYIDSSAASGGDGSYAHPYNAFYQGDEWYTDSRGYSSPLHGRIYLLKRDSTLHSSLYVSNGQSSSQSPIVIGAYGQGGRPVIDPEYGDGVGIYLGSRFEDDEETGYVYMQNLEVVHTRGAAIRLGRGRCHHDMTLLDVRLHDNGAEQYVVYEGDGKGAYMWDCSWNEEYKPGLDQNIMLVNVEIDHNYDDGLKGGAAGLKIINMYSHDNGDNGIRFLGTAGGNYCHGCVSEDDGHTGIQIRSPNTTLQYFKSYGSYSYSGVAVWAGSTEASGDVLVRDGEINEKDRCLRIWGYMRGVTVDNVTVHDCSSYAAIVLSLDGVTRDITIQNSTFYDSDGRGIWSTYYDGDDRTSTLNLKLLGNIIHDSADEAVYLTYVNGGEVSGNRIWGNGIDEPVLGTSATGITVENNEYDAP